MYTYHTKTFLYYLTDSIDEWLNSFYDKNLTNSQQNVEIVKVERIDREVFILIKVFKV